MDHASPTASAVPSPPSAEVTGSSADLAPTSADLYQTSCGVEPPKWHTVAHSESPVGASGARGPGACGECWNARGLTARREGERSVQRSLCEARWTDLPCSKLPRKQISRGHVRLGCRQARTSDAPSGKPA